MSALHPETLFLLLEGTVTKQASSRSIVGAAHLILLPALLFAVSSASQAQSVGIALVPSVQRIDWHDDLAFSNEWLYGGRLSLLFGKYVELQPFYFTRDGYGLDSSRVESVFGSSAIGRGLDMRHYGTSVQLNLGDGALVPFVRTSAGVLRLKPEGAERQDRITLSAGGGLRFGVAGLNAEVFAEQMGVRMNPRGLFEPDTTTGVSLRTFRNLVYGAAVTIPLSTAREEDMQDDGLRGSTAPIEPFVGVLRYDGAFGLEDQELAGVRAGIDFSPVFGLRGFYWRGVNADRDGTVPVTGYGGEAQFNLNTGPGVSPYLIVGAGQIDYGDKFRDTLGQARDNKSAFIIGGGASLRLTDRIRLNGAIRDYIMTVDENLDNVATTGDLTHNTMLTAGLTISLGGRMDSPDRKATSGRETERERELRELREMRELRELRTIREERMELEREMRGDREMRRGRDSMLNMRDARGGMGSDGRYITVPVPLQGEVILRYGIPSRDMTGGLRVDSTVVMGSSGDVARSLADIERRLTERLDAIERAQQTTPRQGAAPGVTVVTPGVMRADTPIDSMPVFRRLREVRSQDLQPYVGLGARDGDVQFIVGARADLGPLSAGSGFRFVPELAVGLGGNLSVLAMANMRYAFGSETSASVLRPYVTVGGGIYTPTVLGINTAIGSSIRLREANERPLFLNLELQGLNLFSETRVLIGISRSR